MFGRDRRCSPEHQAALRRGQAAAWKRASAGEGFIYVAAVAGTDLVKVGFSLDPERRVRDWGGRATLIGQFPASRAAERQFHRLHRDHAVEGEFYRRAYFMAEAA